MNARSSGPPVVRTILSLFMVIVALLGWMLAGSTVLADTVEGLNPDNAVIWISIPLGLGYLLLGWAIHRQRSWALWLALVLLCAVMGAGIADLERPGIMALDATLTMLLAAMSSMAAIVALSIPALERLARHADAGGHADSD